MSKEFSVSIDMIVDHTSDAVTYIAVYLKEMPLNCATDIAGFSLLIFC